MDFQDSYWGHKKHFSVEQKAALSNWRREGVTIVSHTYWKNTASTSSYAETQNVTIALLGLQECLKSF